MEIKLQWFDNQEDIIKEVQKMMGNPKAKSIYSRANESEKIKYYIRHKICECEQNIDKITVFLQDEIAIIQEKQDQQKHSSMAQGEEQVQKIINTQGQKYEIMTEQLQTISKNLSSLKDFRLIKNEDLYVLKFLSVARYLIDYWLSKIQSYSLEMMEQFLFEIPIYKELIIHIKIEMLRIIDEEYNFLTAIKQLGISQEKLLWSDREELNKILFDVLEYPMTQLALKHQKACLLGNTDRIDLNFEKINRLDRCPCCGFICEKQKLPLCVNIDEIDVGIGVMLFFRNYLFHTLIFFIMFIMYSIYAITTNIISFKGTFEFEPNMRCFVSEEDDCGISVISAGVKVLNQETQTNNYSLIQSYLGLGFVILWGILYLVKIYFDKIFIIQKKNERVNASNFTLVFSRVPLELLLENNHQKNDNISNERMKQLFQNRFKNFLDCFTDKKLKKGSLQIQKINIAAPLYLINNERQRILGAQSGFSRILKKVRKLVFQWKREKKFLTSKEERQTYYNLSETLTKHSQQIEKHIFELGNNVLFVTVKNEQQMEFIKDLYDSLTIEQIINISRSKISKSREFVKNNKEKQNDNDNSLHNFSKIQDSSPEARQISQAHLYQKLLFVKVRRAPEPQQIKWETIGFPKKGKVQRRLLTGLATFVLIGVSTGISVGISYAQNTQPLNLGHNVGLAFVITGINIIIEAVLSEINSMENEYIHSRQQYFLALKIGGSQLINSIVVPIIAILIIHGPELIQSGGWLEPGNLSDDVFFISVLNAFSPLYTLYSAMNIPLRIQRRWYKKPKNRLELQGQDELNEYYDGEDFEIGAEYSFLINTAVFTAFFVCMQPIISICAVIGFGISYFVQKYVLLRYARRPHYHQDIIDKYVNMMAILSLPLFGLGSLLTNYFAKNDGERLQNGTLGVNIATTIVGLFFALLIFSLLISRKWPEWFLFLLEKSNNQTSSQSSHLSKMTKQYDDEKKRFRTDYDVANVKTRKQALQSQLQQVTFLQNISKLILSQISPQIKSQSKVGNYSTMGQNSTSYLHSLINKTNPRRYYTTISKQEAQGSYSSNMNSNASLLHKLAV